MNIKLVEAFNKDFEINNRKVVKFIDPETAKAFQEFLREQEKLINEQIEREYICRDMIKKCPGCGKDWNMSKFTACECGCQICDLVERKTDDRHRELSGHQRGPKDTVKGGGG